jgi:hypothetical protein
MANKVIVSPAGPISGRWVEDSSTTPENYTIKLSNAELIDETLIAGVIATLDPTGSKGLYSSTPSTPPPPPPGI